MELLVSRIDDDGVQTLGTMYVLNESGYIQFSCKTLELPWKDNEVQVSCIPKGEYDVELRWSTKFKDHFHITDVEGRTYILIHSGNYHTQILGCILVGDDFIDINGDKRLDVTNSRNTLDKLLGIMPDKFKLNII